MLESILAFALGTLPCLREAPDPVRADLAHIAKLERARAAKQAAFARAMDDYYHCLDDYGIDEEDNDGHCDDPREW